MILTILHRDPPLNFYGLVDIRLLDSSSGLKKTVWFERHFVK